MAMSWSLTITRLGKHVFEERLEHQWHVFFDAVKWLAENLPPQEFAGLVGNALPGGHLIISVKPNYTAQQCTQAALAQGGLIDRWRLDNRVRNGILAQGQKYLLKINNDNSNGNMFGSIVAFARAQNPSIIITITEHRE